jgi:molybdopterin molybdotransferase
MPEKKKDLLERLLPYDEALAALLDRVTWTLPAETTPVMEALGRVLRENIDSTLDVPPFDRSAMDGYAVRAADTRGACPAAPVRLKVVDDLPAGKAPSRRIGKGQAARIMTGAPLPPGADAVVMVEHTTWDEGTVAVACAADPGDNLGRRGEDVEKGARVFAAGTVIGPAEMGMLAALGRARVKVARRPRVAVLSTGDEIEAPGRKLKPGRIYDANQYSLAGLAWSLGCVVGMLGIARDRARRVEERLEVAEGADVVLLTGGVSVGDYDLMADILPAIGVKKIFHGVRIQPGKPTYAGIRRRTFFFGLPGNPVSCMVCAQLFARPCLDKLVGRGRIGLARGEAVLAEDFKLRPGRRKFLRAEVVGAGPEIRVRIWRDQKSGVLTSMLKADVLVDLPGEAAAVKAGNRVEILWLREAPWRS